MPAFRIFVSMSATGSDTLILISYQLDFVTPGISPSLASFRKQRRHISNFRKKPRGLPQILQRLTVRVLYLGVFCAFIIIAFLAILRFTSYSSIF
jgi:hypothetical protein